MIEMAYFNHFAFRLYYVRNSNSRVRLRSNIRRIAVSRTFFITGASGIAAATARLASKNGHNVFVFSKEREQCEAVTRDLPNSAFSIGRVEDESAVTAAVLACRDHFSQIDSVFNVAGISGRSLGDGPLHECSTEAWNTLFQIHASGTFFVCREVIKHWLTAKRGGAILNTSSVLARFPERTHFATNAYPASKGAVEAMTLSAAAYYAPHRIRLNVLAPGLVQTPMSARAQSDASILAFIVQKQPLTKDLTDPNDLAHVACFLLSDEARSITGEIIRADGGWAITG
jgi:NAD(P)-dependent dehydrogenase (short-subunit alcohol dehydrogenase family)